MASPSWKKLPSSDLHRNLYFTTDILLYGVDPLHHYTCVWILLPSDWKDHNLDLPEYIFRRLVLRPLNNVWCILVTWQHGNCHPPTLNLGRRLQRRRHAGKSPHARHQGSMQQRQSSPAHSAPPSRPYLNAKNRAQSTRTPRPWVLDQTSDQITCEAGEVAFWSSIWKSRSYTTSWWM